MSQKPRNLLKQIENGTIPSLEKLKEFLPPELQQKLQETMSEIQVTLQRLQPNDNQTLDLAGRKKEAEQKQTSESPSPTQNPKPEPLLDPNVDPMRQQELNIEHGRILNIAGNATTLAGAETNLTSEVNDNVISSSDAYHKIEVENNKVNDQLNSQVNEQINQSMMQENHELNNTEINRKISNASPENNLNNTYKQLSPSADDFANNNNQNIGSITGLGFNNMNNPSLGELSDTNSGDLSLSSGADGYLTPEEQKRRSKSAAASSPNQDENNTTNSPFNVPKPRPDGYGDGQG